MSSSEDDNAHHAGQEDERRTGARGASPVGAPATQPTVLFLLNSPAASLQLVAAAAERGLRVVGPFDTMSRAAAWLERHTPETVVMDIALQDGETFEFARELRRREIRFLFFTPLGNLKRVPVDMRGALFLQNPKQVDLLLRMLATMASKPR